MSNFRYPNITGFSEKEQLHQLKSYLYQLVEQLNNTSLASEPVGASIARPQVDVGIDPYIEKHQSAAADFAALKGLIIKSADIVDAYCEKLEKKLDGRYVAQSEFGSYLEATSSQITANSTKMEQKYQSLQQIVTDLETRLLETSGYIRTGVLFYAGEGDPLPANAPVYGMEVGQQAEDGTFRRFGRFTSYSLSFFDAQGTEFASITEGRLTIRHAAVERSLTLGGFTDEVLPDGSLTTRWKGI